MTYPAPYILQNVRIVDPLNAIDSIGSIGIANGVFTPSDNLPGAPRINLHGIVAAPGFIDMHVHLRDPGQYKKEDICSGTRAAATGGFTTLIAMANTCPPIDTPEALTDLYTRINRQAHVRVFHAATLSIKRQGIVLTDFAALKAAGAIVLSDDGACMQNTLLMRKACLKAQAAGLPIIDHCEDSAISDMGIFNTGILSHALDISSIDNSSEEAIVARDILLAQEYQTPIHLQHISSAGSCSLINWAHQLNLPVTAEVTPHHLCMNETGFIEYKSYAKMNPPLRGECDRKHILNALRQENISVIATDHAPHTRNEKNKLLDRSPFGIIGLESAIPLCLSLLVHGGVLNLMQFVAKFTSIPRQILHLPYGTITPGSPADLTLIDLHREQALNVNNCLSRSTNSPFHTWRCQGAIAGTIINGGWRYSNIPGINSGEHSI